MAFRIWSILFVAISTSFSFQSALGDGPCPFNSDCQCEIPYQDYGFTNAVCQSKQSAFPEFKKQPAGKGWTLFANLKISPSVDQIPPFAFDSFKEMRGLWLNQSNVGHAVEAKWSPGAFDGKNGSHPQIESIVVSGLSGVITNPELAKLGSRGLIDLQIDNGKENLNLKSGLFKGFPKLQSLAIIDTPIAHMDADVFKDVADTLVGGLLLRGTNLRAYPKDQLSPLKNLYMLDLSFNGMKEFTESCFKDLNVTALDLSGNDINAVAQAKALKDLSKSVVLLYLQNGSLTSIPKDLMPLLNEGTAVFMASNNINSLKKGDFKNAGRIATIDLSNNPIANIEMGALEDLATVDPLLLTDTKLASFDVSVLKGMNSLMQVILDDNAELKSIKGGEIPANLQVINLKNTGLETIDESVKAVLESSHFFMLNLADSKHIKCDEKIHWLAKYAVCEKFPHVGGLDSAKCSNGTLLRQYLKDAVKDACK